MATILDYIAWRGDLPMTVDGFNVVDSLIFTQLAYLPLDNIVPAVPSADSPRTSFEGQTAEAVLLSQAAEQFAKNTAGKPDTFLGAALPPELVPLMAAAGKSERFGNLPVFSCSSITDYRTQKQFAAVSFLLPCTSLKTPSPAVYIAFRGTDDTLVGWKEDFNMSFITPVPAQESAAAYINQTAGITALRIPAAGLQTSVRPNDEPLIVSGTHGGGLECRTYAVPADCPVITGGHSKGGNLAIYAAAFCKPDISSRITGIYNFDGPGFTETVLSSSQYCAIRDRITTVVPQTSIVGMLFTNKEPALIAESTAFGIMQHSAVTWNVCGTALQTAQNRDKTSIVIDNTMRDFINSLSCERRAIFVDTLFDILGASGARTLSDLNRDKLKTAASIMTALKNLAPAEREILHSSLKTLIDSSMRNVRGTLFDFNAPGKISM